MTEGENVNMEGAESEEMNTALRGGGAAPPQELLTAHERIAIEGLRAGVVPELAGDLWRFVGMDATLATDAEVDAVEEVARIKVTRPQLFDDEQTAFNRTLRGAGLPAYTAATTSGEQPVRTGSANGGVMRMEPDEPTLNDKLREAFERTRRSGHSNEGGL